jgi:hypothetical protein
LLASVDDAEQSAYEAKVFPKLDANAHKLFSEHMAIALRAGLALNEAVIHAPESPEAKISLGMALAEVGVLSGIAHEVLPPDSIVIKNIDAVLAALKVITPVVLENK